MYRLPALRRNAAAFLSLLLVIEAVPPSVAQVQPILSRTHRTETTESALLLWLASSPRQSLIVGSHAAVHICAWAAALGGHSDQDQSLGLAGLFGADLPSAALQWVISGIGISVFAGTLFSQPRTKRAVERRMKELQKVVQKRPESEWLAPYALFIAEFQKAAKAPDLPDEAFLKLWQDMGRFSFLKERERRAVGARLLLARLEGSRQWRPKLAPAWTALLEGKVLGGDSETTCDLIEWLAQCEGVPPDLRRQAASYGIDVSRSQQTPAWLQSRFESSIQRLQPSIGGQPASRASLTAVLLQWLTAFNGVETDGKFLSDSALEFRLQQVRATALEIVNKTEDPEMVREALLQGLRFDHPCDRLVEDVQIALIPAIHAFARRGSRWTGTEESFWKEALNAGDASLFVPVVFESLLALAAHPEAPLDALRSFAYAAAHVKWGGADPELAKTEIRQAVNTLLARSEARSQRTHWGAGLLASLKEESRWFWKAIPLWDERPGPLELAEAVNIGPEKVRLTFWRWQPERPAHNPLLLERVVREGEGDASTPIGVLQAVQSLYGWSAATRSILMRREQVLELTQSLYDLGARRDDVDQRHVVYIHNPRFSARVRLDINRFGDWRIKAGRGLEDVLELTGDPVSFLFWEGTQQRKRVAVPNALREWRVEQSGSEQTVWIRLEPAAMQRVFRKKMRAERVIAPDLRIVFYAEPESDPVDASGGASRTTKTGSRAKGLPFTDGVAPDDTSRQSRWGHTIRQAVDRLLASPMAAVSALVVLAVIMGAPLLLMGPFMVLAGSLEYQGGAGAPGDAGRRRARWASIPADRSSLRPLAIELNFRSEDLDLRIFNWLTTYGELEQAPDAAIAILKAFASDASAEQQAHPAHWNLPPVEQLIQEALGRENGFADIVRLVHPYSRQVLADPDAFHHHFALHEGTYYRLWALRLLGRLPKGGVRLVNIDPHSDLFTEDHVRVESQNVALANVPPWQISDAIWAGSALRDGLASEVLKISMFPKHLAHNYARLLEGTVIRSMDLATVPQLAAAWTPGDHAYVTFDTDSMSVHLPFDGGISLHQPIEHLPSQMEALSGMLRALGVVPDALDTAVSLDYLVPRLADAHYQSEVKDRVVAVISALAAGESGPLGSPASVLKKARERFWHRQWFSVSALQGYTAGGRLNRHGWLARSTLERDLGVLVKMGLIERQGSGADTRYRLVAAAADPRVDWKAIDAIVGSFAAKPSKEASDEGSRLIGTLLPRTQLALPFEEAPAAPTVEGLKASLGEIRDRHASPVSEFLWGAITALDEFVQKNGDTLYLKVAAEFIGRSVDVLAYNPDEASAVDRLRRSVEALAKRALLPLMLVAVFAGDAMSASRSARIADHRLSIAA